MRAESKRKRELVLVEEMRAVVEGLADEAVDLSSHLARPHRQFVASMDTGSPNSPLNHEPTSLHSFSNNSMGFSEERHDLTEEAAAAGIYAGTTEAVDGGGTESQRVTTPALDVDVTVPNRLPKTTTRSAKKKRRGGTKKKKSARVGTHTRFPAEDDEASTYADLPTSVSAPEATTHSPPPQAEEKDDPLPKPFLDGRRIYARDGSVKEVHGTDRCVYRPDGSRIPGLRWVLQTAAKSTRSEQVYGLKKPAALDDPKQAVGVHTRFLHGRVAEPKDTGASENGNLSLSLSVSGGGVGSG